MKTMDNIRKLITALSLPQKHLRREYMQLYIHAPSVLQSRDAGAVPAGVAPLAGAAIYLGALLNFVVAQP